jgi:hypothetical protein
MDRIEKNYFTHREGTTPPWHGKVFRTHNGTWEDFLDASHMGPEADFIERKCFSLTVAWSEFVTELGNLATSNRLPFLADYCRKALTSAEGYKMLIRKFDRKAFPVASTYRVHQPRQILEVARRLYEAGGLELDTAMWLDEGRMIAFSAKINGDWTVSGPKPLSHHGRLNGVTGMIGQRASSFFTSVTCIVCANTLAVAESEGGKRARFLHRSDFSEYSIEEALSIVKNSKESVSAYVETAERLRAIPIDRRDKMEFVTRFLGENSLLEEVISASSTDLDSVIAKTEERLSNKGRLILDAITNSPGSDYGMNAFSLLQGTTYVATHKRLRNKEDDDSHLTSSVVGPRSQWGKQALNVIEMMNLERKS